VEVEKREGKICYNFFMRQKNTVYSPAFHNQFQKTEEQVGLAKGKKVGVSKKEEKEGQSEYRIKEATKKQSI